MEISHGKHRSICIIGMHRSGTSLLSRSISLLDIHIGDSSEMVATNEFNEMGYWERHDFRIIQDHILDQLGSRWDTVFPIPSNFHLSDNIKSYKDNLKNLCKDFFLTRSLSAWKDPRTSLLLPLWKDVLNEIGVSLLCIFAVRNPIDVAMSLKKRDGFPLDKSFGIWFNYNISALKNISDIPTAFVSYDTFLSNWESELKRVSSILEIPWPENKENLVRNMDSLIRKDLRHSVTDIDELKKKNAPKHVISLYELLKDMAKLSAQPADFHFTKINELYNDFLSHARLLKYQVTDQLKDQIIENKICLIQDKNTQIEKLKNSISWKITSPGRKLIKLISRSG